MTPYYRTAAGTADVVKDTGADDGSVGVTDGPVYD